MQKESATAVGEPLNIYPSTHSSIHPCIYLSIYLSIYTHPEVDRTGFLKGVCFFENAVIFDPIWIPGWWFSAFCLLRDGFIYHILSMGLENDLFSSGKSWDCIYSRMAISIYVSIYLSIYRCVQRTPSLTTAALRLRRAGAVAGGGGLGAGQRAAGGGWAPSSLRNSSTRPAAGASSPLFLLLFFVVKNAKMRIQGKNVYINLYVYVYL